MRNINYIYTNARDLTLSPRRFIISLSGKHVKLFTFPNIFFMSFFIRGGTYAGNL